MSAEIIWDFTALRHAQIEEERQRVTAEVIALALDGAPNAYAGIPHAYSGSNILGGCDADLVYYVTPSNNVELPSDCEPA